MKRHNFSQRILWVLGAFSSFGFFLLKYICTYFIVSSVSSGRCVSLLGRLISVVKLVERRGAGL